MADSNTLINRGWVQGAVLKSESITEEFRAHLKESFGIAAGKKSKISRNALLIVSSQDCDIAFNDPIEKVIEFVKFTPEKTPQVNNDFGNSSRYLNISLAGVDGASTEKIYKASVNQIVRCSKDLLLSSNLRPAYQLDKAKTATLAQWRANRYLRDPFPDEFCDIAMPILKKQSVKDFFLQHSEDIFGVFLYLDSYEEKNQYNFALYGVCSDGVSNENFIAISDHLEKLSESLNAVTGLTQIDLSKNALFAESFGDTLDGYFAFRSLDIPYGVVITSRKWDYNSITIKGIFHNK